VKVLPPKIANSLWQAFSTMNWYKFHRTSTRLEEVQWRILRNYLITNKNTDYGNRYEFKSIHNIDDYQNRVPLTTYEDYIESIESIGSGKLNVLTAEPVKLFEITSGSTSASKLIPYTQSLRNEFQQAISVWIVDLFKNYPELKNGLAYWSITPLVDGRNFSEAGIPIGFEDDSAYLSNIGKYLVDATMAVPNAVKNIGNINSFRYITLLFLLHQSRLRIISIWNPTYLTLLLNCIPEYWQNLLKDIANGTLSPPFEIDIYLQRYLLKRLHPDPNRAKILLKIKPDDFNSLWPDLGLISCWKDAGATSFAQSLQDIFPNVFMQGKGLIATEAIVSFPVDSLEGAVLASTSHFFEFIHVDSKTFNILDTKPKLAHQLIQDETYEVIVTTGGGLYRYQMHDIVQVVDYLDQIPCLRFIGKADNVSDLFGEKLNEQFVFSIITELMRENNLATNFVMLAPNDKGIEFHYTLYLELQSFQSNLEIHPDFPLKLDQKLRQNFHYDYCRKLGQLATPDIFIIKQGATKAYLDKCMNQGQRLGDIKPTSLHKNTGWDKVFSGLKKIKTPFPGATEMGH